ncbi:MAG: HD family hydrolase [Sulfolobus sp.]|nr:HD family hydrolase [Sulfolobus sp.]
MQLERALVGSKNLVRTGWMQRGIPPSLGETVAQHCWEAGVLAYYLGTKLKEKGIFVSPERASSIALFHDIGESILGDLPKWASEKIEDKEEVELEAIKELGVDENLFIEYKEAKTLEGKIAKLSDRLSTYLQALRYSKLGYDVGEIIKTYEREIGDLLKDEKLATLHDEIRKLIKNISEK